MRRAAVSTFIFSLSVSFVAIAVTTVYADPVRCRSTIGKAAAKYAQVRMNALAKCEAAIVKGALPALTDCSTDTKTAAALSKAVTKLDTAIAKSCGGADKSCGNGDDDILATIGWDVGLCPDYEQSGCDMPIAHCGNISDCLSCVADTSVERLRALYFDAVDLGSAAGSSLEKCQSTIGKAAAKYYRSRSKAMAKCWGTVNKGSITGPCPIPGDGKAQAAILKAESKKIAAICKACGGSDKACDDTTGGVVGSGGSDDFAASEIGFVASCPDLTVPGAPASCGISVSTLADIVTCVDCVTDFSGGCADRIAVPWALVSAPECNGGDGDLVYAETFSLPDASLWPAPWVPIGGVAAYDVQGGRARFRPTLSGYSLARLYAPFSEQDVEVTLTLEFSDVSTQGLGFYVRQNGGYLAQTVPNGQGYAVFIEGFRASPGIGVWREINGVEQDLSILFDPALNFQNGVRYRVRFRVNQSSATETTLRAKIWPEAGVEPTAWHVEYVDGTPQLQNISGGFAVDAWSSHTTGGPASADQFFDDVEIHRLANPLTAMGAVTLVQEGFTFLEGPRWRAADGVLLFTDIPASTIHRLTPPAAVDVFRAPSDEANGLANAINGDLIAAEHASRRVSRTDSIGTITTVADSYLGAALNSPNDIAVRSDGTLYFTDPPYGITPPEQELAFNGVFRVAGGGALTAEVMGALTARPNGVALSPDETTLYVSDTDAGTVTAYDVALDGSLSNARIISNGISVADGMCVDVDGNVYVTSLAGVEVFSAAGVRWGVIQVPRQPSNCAFGGADGRTLYITAREGLYRATTTIAGLY